MRGTYPSFSTAALAGLLLALACSSDDKPVKEDRLDLTVGGVSYVLDGIFAPSLTERRQALIDTIASSPVDLLCANQVMLEQDKRALAHAASASFPYSAWVRSDEFTVADDPRDASGALPDFPTEPPCADAALDTLAREALDCGAEHCSVGGADTPAIQDGTCIPAHCAESFLPLLAGEQAHKRCYNCLLYTLMSHVSFADALEQCTSNPRAGFAFGGDNGHLLLSKYPLSDVRLAVLPSTAWRQSVLSARITLPDGSELDVHCTTLQGPHSSSTQPYTGLYGNGASGDAAWAEETKLEARRLVEWVQDDSPTGRALVLGDLYVGPARDATRGPVLAGAVPEAFAIVDKPFRRMLAPGYEPPCTLCGSNPLIDGTGSVDAWTSHIFGHAMEGVEVVSTNLLAAEPVVPVQSATAPGESVLAPVTSRYGLASTIRFEP